MVVPVIASLATAARAAASRSAFRLLFAHSRSLSASRCSSFRARAVLDVGGLE